MVIACFAVVIIFVWALFFVFFAFVAQSLDLKTALFSSEKVTSSRLPHIWCWLVRFNRYCSGTIEQWTHIACVCLYMYVYVCVPHSMCIFAADYIETSFVLFECQIKSEPTSASTLCVCVFVCGCDWTRSRQYVCVYMCGEGARVYASRLEDNEANDWQPATAVAPICDIYIHRIAQFAVLRWQQFFFFHMYDLNSTLSSIQMFVVFTCQFSLCIFRFVSTLVLSYRVSIRSNSDFRISFGKHRSI